MSTRKKTLWLCSWYPSKAAPFNGDFIQRHAKAAALYNDVHVIHVGGAETAERKKYSTTPGLTEDIILYKSFKGFAGKILNHYKWNRLYKRAVEEYILENGRPDLVHVHVPVKSGLIALWLKKKYGIPYVVTEHWGIYNEVLKENYNSKPTWFKRISKNIFKNASACISVSDYLATKIRKYVDGSLKFTVINNVADTDFFYPAEKNEAKFRFIHVSNMIELKRADKILLSFYENEELRNSCELVMVGEKDGYTEVLAGDLGILNKSVFMPGEVPYEKVAEYMQQADCLILFSDIENSPCVIGEALCCGLPVIATNIGGIPELVNTENSVLVKAGDMTELESAMLKIKSSRSGFDKIKIAEAAKSRFSYPVIGRQFDELYKSIKNENEKG